MNNPFDTLMHEHEIITSVEGIVESMSDLWLKDQEEFKQKAAAVVKFLQSYADNYHHRKEEEVLFPAMRNCSDFSLPELIDEFETHHEAFREYVSDILQALEQNEYAEAYKVLCDYLNELLDHIAAENEELFVMAETLLPEDELTTIYFRFEDIDRDLGKEEKQQLEKLLFNTN